MLPLNGSQPSAPPEVKLKPKTHKNRRMRSVANDGNEPALPSSDAEKDGEEEFQEVFARRSKAQPRRDRQQAETLTGVSPLNHSFPEYT
jgi:hypothetical protein